MKAYNEGINPRTGEYYYCEKPKTKVRPYRLVLDMSKKIEPQLPSKIFPDAAQRLEQLRNAFNVLLAGGVLPDNHARRLNKQISMKAERALHVYRKAETAHANAQ